MQVMVTLWSFCSIDAAGPSSDDISAGPSSSDFDAAGPSSYVIAAGPSSSILARAHRRLAHEHARQMLHFNVPFFSVRKLRPTGLVHVNVLFYYAAFLGPRSGAVR
jgi:hypothetical protein